jgi:spermidine/putrescine transport system substrate-binding protein
MSTMNDRPAIPGLRPTGMSRRSVLRALGIGGAVAVGGPLLAACGTEGSSEQTTQDQAAPDKSDTDKSVVWSNWPGYIDYNDDETKRPSVQAFEKKTGIKVTYNEDINDNDEFFGKIRTQLAQGQDTGRDVIVLTDWMAGRLIRLSYVQELNRTNIPNAKNLVPNLQNVGFDPGRKRSLPWQSGFTGIGTNGKALKNVAGITDPSGLTVNDLLTNPKLKGKVTVLTEMRDTMGLIMLDMGKKPEDFTDDDFNAAIAKLGDAVDSGQVRGFTGNDYMQDLASGQIAACLAWSGDVIQLQADDPSIKLVAPESGQMIWSDNLMIPNKAQHKKNAEIVINNYYDPAVAAQVAAWVNYICPIQGAKEEAAKIDPELVNNQLIFPNEATLAKSHVFKALDEATETKYNEAFQQLQGN